MAGSSSSAAIQVRNKELERQLAEMKSKNSGGLSSASAAVRLRNDELERQIAAMNLSKAKSGAMGSASMAIKLMNEALERQVAELMEKKSGGGLSSASVAIKQKNEALERQVAELMAKKSGGGLSSVSEAIKQKNEEIVKRQLAEMPKYRPFGITSASGRRLEGVVERRPMGLRSGLLSRVPTLSLSPSRQRKVNERQVKLMRLIKAAQELDLAFLVDVTGSMQSIIKKVKDSITDIAASAKKEWPDLKLRVAFAPYRDYEDVDGDNDETCDFTNDFSGSQSVFVKALSQVNARGGGDTAEDVFSGLERAARLSWSCKTRVIVHIGDAPCHGSEFHSGVSDKYLAGDKKCRNVGTLLNTLRDDCRVLCYLFVHINSSTEKMVAAFRRHAGAANWIHEEKLDSIENLAKIVVAVASGTISQSVRVGDDSNAEVPKHIPLPVHPNPPVWNKVRAEPARQIRCKFPNSVEDLFQILATGGKLDVEEMSDSSVQIAPYPFSDNGSMRWPYHAIVQHPPQATRHMVVKRFKMSPGQDVNKVHASEAYFEQMEVQTVAAYMAQKFNEELASRSYTGDCKTVEFTMVSIVVVGTKFYNMEKYLEGNWIRYTNNLNYVNTEEYAATLHAFSHWTYERSEGLVMVTDLQGVKRDENEFLLCDPALHCKDSCRYERTRTNFGDPGMKQFLHTHQCNNICRSLLLTPTRNVPTRMGTRLT